MKTYPKAFCLVLLFVISVVCSVVGCVDSQQKKPNNVFEEIYYEQTKYQSEMPSSFEIMIDYGTKWRTYNGARLCISTYRDNLPDSDRIHIYCYKSPHKQIVFEYYTSRYDVSRYITYNFETQTITSSGTLNDFLFDIVLSEWFEAKGKDSQFSINDLGEFTNKLQSFS